MAHEIEDNYAFFASNAPAWHGLGTVLKDAPSIKEAWSLAYPFELFALPLSARVQDDDTGDVEYTEVEGHKAIFRSDGRQIGIVGDKYHLEQPISVFEDFEPLIDSGLVQLEAGGSLREGTRMWALAKVIGSEAEVVRGDTVKAYVLFATGFDGSLARQASQTSVRVVCANTLAMAQNEGIDFKIRHTSSFVDRLNDAKVQIQGALEAHRTTVQAYKHLAAKPANDTKLKAYVRHVIVGPDHETQAKDGKISEPMQRKLMTIDELLETQRGLELVPAVRGTMWQGYNAISEYITHEAGRNEDNRVNNQWFGETAKLNQRALNVALTF